MAELCIRQHGQRRRGRAANHPRVRQKVRLLDRRLLLAVAHLPEGAPGHPVAHLDEADALLLEGRRDSGSLLERHSLAVVEDEQTRRLALAAPGDPDVLRRGVEAVLHQLGQRLVMRHVPQLHFRLDHSIAQGAHLSALIDSAVRGTQGDKDD